MSRFFRIFAAKNYVIMNKTLSRLMQAMVRYDRGDVPRIQHFVKVHDFAATIGVAEGLDDETLFVLEAASILHDIGIHPAEARYGSSMGKYQEELGPGEARKVLAEVGGFTDAQAERICWLIGHHHTYTDVVSVDHRILLEADFLVNSYEDNITREGIEAFRNNVFRSPSAITMLNEMWKLESEYEKFRRMQIEQFEDDITEGRCYPEMPEGQFVRSK